MVKSAILMVLALTWLQFKSYSGQIVVAYPWKRNFTTLFSAWNSQLAYLHIIYIKMNK